MRRKFTVYGLRFSKTSFWNHINTGFPNPAVATALTACGIETAEVAMGATAVIVATALTACGIETPIGGFYMKTFKAVATALTACGIETKTLNGC